MKQKIVIHEADSILIIAFIHEYSETYGLITLFKTIETKRMKGRINFNMWRKHVEHIRYNRWHWGSNICSTHVQLCIEGRTNI